MGIAAASSSPSPPTNKDHAGADGAKETVVVDVAAEAGKEGEEEGECGFCLFMKDGGCKEEFVAWEKCVEDAEAAGKKGDLCHDATPRPRAGSARTRTPTTTSPSCAPWPRTWRPHSHPGPSPPPRRPRSHRRRRGKKWGQKNQADDVVPGSDNNKGYAAASLSENLTNFS
jgi:hypothetical protein